MNEKFVTETSFNKKICYDFVNYVNFYRQWWLYAIIFTLVIVIEYIQTHDWTNIGLYLLAICVICYLSNQISSLVLYKRYGKFLKLRFFENSFYAETQKGREKIDYATIKRLVERPQYFYLFFKGGRGVFIIDKNGFSKGNRDNFREFIAAAQQKAA